MSLSKNTKTLLTLCKDLASSISVSNYLLLLVLTCKWLFFQLFSQEKDKFQFKIKSNLYSEQQGSKTTCLFDFQAKEWLILNNLPFYIEACHMIALD